MSSDIEKIARRLRDLAHETGGMTAGLQAAATRSGDLAAPVEEAGRAGVPVYALLDQLQAAVRKARSAAASVEQVRRHGDEFARQLSNRQGGTSSANRVAGTVKSVVEGIAVGGVLASGIMNFGSAVVRSDPSLPVGERATPAETLHEYTERHAAATDDLDDLREGYESEVDDQVREPEYGEHRPPPGTA